MPAGKRQHYVPKFYFRLFNGGGDTICAFVPKRSELSFTAPIKSQCTVDYLYGDAELEQHFSRQEALHATALRHLIQMAMDPDGTTPDAELHALAYEAILFQSARTHLEAVRHLNAYETLATAVFADHLESFGPDERIGEMTDALRTGLIRLRLDFKSQAISNVWNAINGVPAIQDLRLTLLANTTGRPFIFSDAPVVFYNDLLSQTAPWRAMGICSRGLQIFLPLNPKVMAMLSDLTGCSGQITQSDVIDLKEQSDVSQLNALQLHNCRNVIYFGDPRDEVYVTDLWRAHRRSFRPHETTIDLNREPGKPALDTFVAVVPQPNIRLKLSFVDWSKPIDPDIADTPRNEELYARYSRSPTWANVDANQLPNDAEDAPSIESP